MTKLIGEMLRLSQVYVIIGMPADKLTYQNKGKTVMLENERMEVKPGCLP